MDGKILRILAADCGTSVTKVALIEQSDDRYKFVVQTQVASTHNSPWNDVTLGIVDALEILERKTGYALLSQAGEPLIPRINGKGVDALTVVVSAADPLRVLPVGLMNDVSLNAARRTAATTYSIVQDQSDIAGNVSSLDYAIERRIKTVQHAQADVVVLVGGTDGGAELPVIEQARMLSLALKTMQPDSRPHIIYAGNARLRVKIAEILGDVTDFVSVDNVLPSLGQRNPGPLQAELDTLYFQQKIKALPGFAALSRWISSRLVITARSYSQTIQYLSRSYDINVLGADIGDASVTLTGGRRGLTGTVIRSDLGAGRNAPALLAQVGVESVSRWLPFEMTPENVSHFLLNKGIYPQTVPQTPDEVFLELALARETLRIMSVQLAGTWPAGIGKNPWLNWDLVVGSGGLLTNMPSAALAALALLDGLEPVGIFTLALDSHALIGMAGGLAQIEPAAAAQVVGQDAMLNLGTVIAPVGLGYPGKTALKLRVTYEADGRREDMKIPFGTLVVIPLATNQRARIEARPVADFTLNPTGEMPGRGAAAVVEGGILGLIIDTRGRPLILPEDDADRRLQLQAWLEELGIQPPIRTSEPIVEDE